MDAPVVFLLVVVCGIVAVGTAVIFLECRPNRWKDEDDQ
jgi:hypothetical protein